MLEPQGVCYAPFSSFHVALWTSSSMSVEPYSGSVDVNWADHALQVVGVCWAEVYLVGLRQASDKPAREEKSKDRPRRSSYLG